MLFNAMYLVLHCDYLHPDSLQCHSRHYYIRQISHMCPRQLCRRSCVNFLLSSRIQFMPPRVDIGLVWISNAGSACVFKCGCGRIRPKNVMSLGGRILDCVGFVVLLVSRVIVYPSISETSIAESLHDLQAPQIVLLGTVLSS